MRRFYCIVEVTTDFIRDDDILWKAGVELTSGYFASASEDAEEKAKAAWLARMSSFATLGVEMRVLLEEFPVETAVTIEKILALPEVPKDLFTDRSDEVLHEFMCDLLPDWAHQKVELDLSDVPLRVQRKMRTRGNYGFSVDTYSLHLNELPFAVVVISCYSEEDPDVNVLVFDKTLAEQAAHELLKARMRAHSKALSITLTTRTDPILDFDQRGISIVNGEVREPGRT